MSLRPRRAQTLSVRPLPKCPSTQSFRQPVQERPFHTSPSHNGRSRARQAMTDWLKGPGQVFRNPLPGSTNYMPAYNKVGELVRSKRARAAKQTDAEIKQQKEIEAGLTEEEREARAADRQESSRSEIPPEEANDLRPYPLNHYFSSESVLSEEMREEVYEQVAVRKMDVSSVSSAYGIDIRRVAAVVRLKTIEKQWEKENKPLAKPYQKAVLQMLPVTPLRDAQGLVVRHESINDLPVHPATRNQLFHPASESRKFTRVDAAKAFSPGLLPADERIPHPEMIEIEKWNVQGLTREQRMDKLREKEVHKRQQQAAQEAKQKALEERTQRLVAGRRWDFKFQDISVEQAGPDGRGQHGVGLRYGYAHNDRKRGTVKIPTSVE